MSDYGADSDPDRSLARRLSQQFNLFPIAKTKLDVWTIDADNAVYKFVHKRSKSRLFVKVDLDEFP